MHARIGAYSRISFDGEGEGLGVARQQSDEGKLADLRQWEIVDHYTDNNVSAFKTTVIRPEFERMLVDLESGRIDGIIAYDLDRIARQPTDLERIVRLYEKRRGLVFATVQGSIDLSTADGLTMARVLVAFANKSSMDTSRRIKRKNVERAEQGLPHGSRRPYGYNADQLTLHETEAPILQEMGRRLIAGDSYKRIAWWMNEQGQKTTEGKPWLALTVRNTLNRTRYAGFRIYEGKEYPGIWQPIFDRETWDYMQRILERRKEFTGDRPSNRKYLLTGLLICGKCGGYLNGATKRDKPTRPLRRTYLCRPQGFTQPLGGCGGVTRNADALEHFIRELICYRLDTPELASMISKTDLETPDLLKERAELASRKTMLVDDYADGTLDRNDFVRAQARVDRRLKAIDEQLDQLRRTRLDMSLRAGETVKEAWMTRDDEWRREVVETLIRKITVNVGKTKPFYDADGKLMRFDPSLINIDWLA